MKHLKLFENYNAEYLLGYDSETNAYLVDDYPYGFRLRTQIRYWIETTNRGDRFCSQTLNPKTNRWNKPKKSTYQLLGFMYLDEKEHVTWKSVNIYSKPEEVNSLINDIGGGEKLNPQQLKKLKQIRGEKVETTTAKGRVKKDFTVRFFKRYGDTVDECIVKFNRPDKVSLKEIIDALKSTNQAKLNTVWDNDGIVRINVDKGYQLGTINKETYEKYKEL